MGRVVRLQGRTVARLTLLVDTSVWSTRASGRHEHLVDTSIWSMAFTRDQDSDVPQVRALRDALEGTEIAVTTGLVLQELLQGFNGPRARRDLIERFAALPLLSPDRQDHIDAAELRNRCRRAGVHIGTIDALLAHLCVRHTLRLLTTDNDFVRAAAHCPLRVWR